MENDHSTIKNAYTTHPYKSQVTEQVTGLTNGRSQSSSTSRFLDLPNTYSSDKVRIITCTLLEGICIETSD